MILYKNHFKDARHHLTFKIQTRIMLKTKEILTFLVIGFLAFENCQAFYRPMPSFIENTLNKILHNQLERRFGKLTAITTETPTTTTKDQLEQRFGKLTKVGPQSEAVQTAPQVTIATTTTVETTTSSAAIETTLRPKTQKVKLCRFKTFDACSLDEWTTFLRHVLKNQRRLHFEEKRNKNRKPVSPTLPEKLNFKLGHRLMAFEEKRKNTI